MRKRNAQLVLVAGLVIVLGGSLLVSLSKLHSLDKIATTEAKISMWIASQPLIQLLKLTNLLSSYASGEPGVSARDVEERFDVLWSRVPILSEGRDGKLLRDVVNLSTVTRRVDDTLKDVEPLILSIDSADFATIRTIQDRLASLAPVVNQLYLDAYLQDTVRRAQRTSKFREIYTQIALTLLGILVSSGALVVLLVRQLRRATNLLEATRQAEEALHLSRRAVEATSDGITITERRFNKHRVVYCNPAFERMTGYGKGDVIGRSPRFLQGGDSEQDELAKVRAAIDSGKEYRGVVRNYRKDGTLFWNQLRISPVFDDSQRLTHYVGVQSDITESYNLTQQLSYQATHDSLTGLFNRAEFERHVQAVLHRAHTENTDHALCYLDLDQFKMINDSSGHIAGDELLRQLASVLKTKVRKNDLLARLGGDEFAVLMECCSLDDAERVADVLRRSIAEHRFQWEGMSFTVGASIGLVPITPPTVSMTEVFKAADAACYAAKDSGRNCIHVYREDDAELNERYGEIRWISRINDALATERFELRFQPIVPVNAGRTHGRRYELLLSMRDEDNTIALPGTFLPAAERYGLAGKIDCWVVSNALSWLQSHPAELADTRLCSINLSGHSVSDKKFLDYVIRELKEKNIPPEKICFEITETAAISNLSSATKLVSTLRGLGCSFALDDFGCGVSSFAYLKNLAVDLIKIDGLFVRGICDDPVDWAMVKSINDLGHAMGKKTIAEFVENSDVRDALRIIGVDYAQGFGISEPRPLSTLVSNPSLDLPGVQWA